MLLILENVGKLKLLSPTNLQNYTKALSSFYCFLPTSFQGASTLKF